jgi:transposase
MSGEPVCVGLDVAKATLDVGLRPTGEAWQVANDEPGIAELVARLRRLKPALLVCEATGGFERPVVAALAAAGVRWWWRIRARYGTSPRRRAS